MGVAPRLYSTHLLTSSFSVTNMAAFRPDRPRSLVTDARTWIWFMISDSMDHSETERTETNGLGLGLRRVGNTD
jgi:hypothetical protein